MRSVSLSRLAPAVVASLSLAACFAVPTEEVQGGANLNERGPGLAEGEELLKGAMTVSPDGRWVVGQRADVTVLVDVAAKTTRELPLQTLRHAFGSGDIVYATAAPVKTLWDGFGARTAAEPDRLVALDLATGDVLWTSPVFSGETDVRQLQLSEDGSLLLAADAEALHVLDTATGTELRAVALAGPAEELTILPTGDAALVAETTQWIDGKPVTVVEHVDLVTGTSLRVDVPNCAAPIVLVPGASRALMSPTFCTPGADFVPTAGWTNPDPVSVIDLLPAGPSFVRNLPGFGPVLMADGGATAVAFLDMQRVDASLFDDPTQVPPADGPQFYLMQIDPTTLAFELSTVGAHLPRFALAKDGQSLIVDATLVVRKGVLEASATVSIGPDGVSASASLFAGIIESRLLGIFDLASRTLTPFSGDFVSMSRFVQSAEGRVFSLFAHERGGVLFELDRATMTTQDLGLDVRDLNILPDLQTLVLRFRLPPIQANQLQEDFCFYSVTPFAELACAHYEQPEPPPGQTGNYFPCDP
ncbi:MAG: PQQ-like beta-propeller repeat protein [Myxococcales bacterium]|nr:PQQ-like beta-propeller repeat protein [Myxococcales bacterium]